MFEGKPRNSSNSNKDVRTKKSLLQSKFWAVSIVLLTMGVAVLLPRAAVAQSTLPTGEREFQQNDLEPGYNDLTGKITYFMTPNPEKAPDKANGNAVANLYIIVYPMSAAGSVGTLNCEYSPDDNCPSHGSIVEFLANEYEPGVYGDGVWGHDHLLAAPPSPPVGGGDFNVSWAPVFVFFTKSAYANTHITTLDELTKAMGNHEVITFTGGNFYCAVVPATLYDAATPVPPVPPTY